ncbi:hypothetical protein GY45DRAFT_200236 [Cubamyces sp. BRFM 1775]|nr:hypothetical protein GY45DRAFT_200236 [Cubamyces sp. BRFM 1775]
MCQSGDRLPPLTSSRECAYLCGSCQLSCQQPYPVTFDNPRCTNSSTFQVHKRREAPPSMFTHIGLAPAEQTISLRLAIVQSDLGGLINRLYQVSDPDKALYGQYLSKAEVSQAQLR